MTVFVPMIVAQSNYLYPYGSIIIIIQALLVVYFRMSSSSSSQAEEGQDSQSQPKQAKLEYLTAYRSLLLVMTFIAILAVDFHIFPRRFAKTELEGYGLMDLGAASFAISAGLVSTKSRKYYNIRKGNNHTKVSSNNNKFLLHVLPLVIIGLIRIITNKSLEYQEHVTEYGVHWNFFFTLGVLAIVPKFAENRPPSIWVPWLMLIVYQSMLSVGGLQQFIETAARSCPPGSSVNDLFPSGIPQSLCDTFYANREGILGCFGYLSLYFLGEWIGASYLWNTTTNSIVSSSRSLELLCVGGWSLLAILTNLLDIPVSRRSTNASFCLWCLSHNVTLLILLKHLVVKPPRQQQQCGFPVIMERMNKHGLPIFLIANLLTGLVNLTVPTLDVSDGKALLVLFGYVSSIGIVAILLEDVVAPLLRSSSQSKKTSKTH